MGDPKKMKRLKKKKPPEGFVTWNEATFTRLIESEPEMLKPRLRITHSVVLAEVEQGGDAWARVLELIEASLQTPEEKAKLKLRAAEIFATLIDAGVVVREACGTEAVSYTHLDVYKRQRPRRTACPPQEPRPYTTERPR